MTLNVEAYRANRNDTAHDYDLTHAEVWAYGSRVTGGAHEGSDLDLVVRDPDEVSREVPGVDGLREALQRSALPLLVEVHQWAHLPAAFRREIEAAYVVLQSEMTSADPRP
jgi:predicted nucleotidyltransferase